MIKALLFISAIYAIVYLITIIAVYKLLKGINQDCEEEQLELMQKIVDYEKIIKNVQARLKNLKSMQLYGNPNLVINLIEEKIEKELSNTDQSFR